MQCPKCGNRTKTLETRHGYCATRRRKECTVCGYRFSTQERIMEQTDEPTPIPDGGFDSDYQTY